MADSAAPVSVPATTAPLAQTADAVEWVEVTHPSVKGGPNGVVSREWLDGWGKEQGWTEAKTK